MRRHYDHIIIDTPPVLLVPDARIAGSVADEILLVIKWDTTTRAQVRGIVTTLFPQALDSHSENWIGTGCAAVSVKSLRGDFS